MTVEDGTTASGDEWSVATFDGLRAAQRSDAAAATAAQRLRTVEELLQLALASGALEKVRRRRQEECDAWARENLAPETASEP